MKLAPKQIAQAGAATGNPLLWSGSRYAPAPNVAMALSGLDGSATVGATTIDAPTGISTIAAGATTCVVTNNLATAYCKVTLEWYGDHGATRSWVVRANGSFTVTLSSAAAANTSFGWTVSGMTSSMLNGLIHYWPLDGNSNDAYVTGNGTDTAVTYTTPKLGTACAAFNGSTSKIQTAIDGPTGAAPRSISMWLKRTKTGDVTALFHGVDITNGAFEVVYRGGLGWGVFTGYNNLVNQPVGNLNQWYHFVVTYDGTTLTSYQDGANPISTTTTLATQAGPIDIGAMHTYGGWFPGLIDDTCMWDRALTAGEVATLYNSGAGLETMSGSLLTGLIHQWHFNGNSNDALTTGIETSITYAAGKLNQCAVFNGTDSIIQTEAMLPLSNTDFSLGMWVYRGPDGNQHDIFGWGGYFLISYAGGIYPSWGGAITLTSGAWHYYTLTHNASGETKHYVDGTLLLTETFTFNNTAIPIRIGRRTSAAVYPPFQGSLDDIATWNRTLDAAEVTSLYNAGTGVETLTGSLLTGLTHQWHLNGNAVDNVINGNGTDTAVTYGGKSGQCAMFNGTTSTITTPSLLKPSTWSMSCWIKPPPATSEAFGGGWLIGNPAAGQCAYWMRASATPTSWNLNNGSGASAIPHTIATDVWSHVVITYNGTQGAAYVNGALAAGPTALAIASSTGTIKIGHLTNITSVGHFNGLIDEPAMWSRALSAAEVTNLYNAGAGRYYPSFA